MKDIKNIDILIKARKAYYNTGHPLMTDQEYDALEQKVKGDFPNHPVFEKIGHAPSSAWKTDKHKIFMGSLDKYHEPEHIIKWAKKLFNDDILPNTFCMQLKLDGLSLSLNYSDSKFINALTRGDGKKGEDISDNVRLMVNFKDTIKDFTGSIRSEIILSKQDFKEINKSLPEKERYSNPRNAAAGISRRLDGRFCKYLQLITYDISEDLDEPDKIKRLQDIGLITVKQTIGPIDELINTFNKLKENRENLPYDIDGVVFKINSNEIQKKLGHTRNKPKGQMALKFDPPGSITTFLTEVWDVGRTGAVTPLALLEPVKIEGSTVSKATLHNVAEIKRLGIGHGDTVMVVKRGDIIPKIIKIIEHKGSPIKIPTTCPSCETELLNDGIKLTCINDECPKKNLNRVLYWIKVTGIEDYGESLGKELESTGKVKRIQDIYNLTINDISNLEGWGYSSAKKIIENINNTRTLTPETFLTAVGIPGISERTSEDLLKAFGTLNDLMDKNVEDIKKLKGFSDISANNIIAGLIKYRDEIENLLKVINLSSENNDRKFSGLSFCFTGAMEHPRSYYQKLVEYNGGTSKSSVTRDLTFLVCNENKGSNKSRKAESYGTKVINEKEFLDMIEEQPQDQETKTPKIENYSLFE